MQCWFSFCMCVYFGYFCNPRLPPTWNQNFEQQTALDLLMVSCTDIIPTFLRDLHRVLLPLHTTGLLQCGTCPASHHVVSVSAASGRARQPPTHCRVPGQHRREKGVWAHRGLSASGLKHVLCTVKYWTHSLRMWCVGRNSMIQWLRFIIHVSGIRCVKWKVWDLFNQSVDKYL